MRGRLLGGSVDHEWLATRRLLAAVVGLAARDAARGVVEAQRWLTDYYGGESVALVLGYRADAFAQPVRATDGRAQRAGHNRRGFR